MTEVDNELQQIVTSLQKTFRTLLRKHAKHASEERIDSFLREVSYSFFSHVNATGSLIYPAVTTASEMEETYRKFVQTDFEKSSFDLSSIYKIPNYRIYPGELVLVQGDTKIGKTAWVQDLCVKLTQMNILYLSLEVHEILCYRRFIQQALGMNRDDIFTHYKSDGKSLCEAIKHIGVVTAPCDFNFIKRLVQQHRPQIVVIDTADSMINYTIKEELSAESKIAFGLKALAQDCNVIVIAIHHISKDAAKIGKLGLHSGKGSSSFEQQADKLIGIEVVNNTARHIRSIAARDEAGFDLIANIDWETFRFTQVEDPSGKLIPTLSEINRVFRTGGYFDNRYTKKGS